MSKPEIRLKGFEGEWIKVLLGELFKERVESDIHGEMLSVTMNKGIILASENGLYDNSNSDKSHYKLVKIGDIAYNSMRMWQGASGCSDYEGIVSPAYTVLKPNEGICSPFFATLFKNKKMINSFRLHSQGLTSDTWNLKYPAFSKIAAYYPLSQDEQSVIAEYFKSLASMIQAAIKKIASLKQLKSASLISMFPQKGETKPRVRFKEFEGEWESVPLSQFSKKVTKKNLNLEYRITLTNSAEYGIINQLDFFDHEISNGDNIRGYYIVENDDFVYNPRISVSAPVGPINRNLLGYAGVMSPLYYVFKVFGIDKDYLSVFFKTKLWHKFMKDNGNSGARFDRLSITDDVFVQMPILYPSNPKEQQKIASFFTNLDKQISLQEQRLEKLKQIKSACLDKMFV